jgi:thiosulfate dehydrogenase (quinone) large subunit
MSKLVMHEDVQVSDPPLVQKLFGSRALAWIWILPRLYVGYSWFDASRHKIADPTWVNTGEALKGFWLTVVATTPRPVAYFDWYRGFIQFMLDTQAYTWFGKLVAYGELAIGIALILGAFTGLAAFFGGFMNWNFMMAGTASSNPLLFAIGIALILAWKTAGYWGADRFLLPLLGTPWKPAIKVNMPTPQARPTLS